MWSEESERQNIQKIEDQENENIHKTCWHWNWRNWQLLDLRYSFAAAGKNEVNGCVNSGRPTRVGWRKQKVLRWCAQPYKRDSAVIDGIHFHINIQLSLIHFMAAKAELDSFHIMAAKAVRL